MLQRLSVEVNLTEHCNLSCRACDHASPLLPRMPRPAVAEASDPVAEASGPAPAAAELAVELPTRG